MKGKTRLKELWMALWGRHPIQLLPTSNFEPAREMGNLLAGKNALITAAGKNIGRGIAIEMAKQGANIFFTEIDPAQCVELEKELRKYQGFARGILSDITKTEDIDALCSHLEQEGIQVDVLVNNSGIGSKKINFRDMSKDEWYKTFETNLFGPLYLTKLIAGRMIRNQAKGSIIFITSIHQWTVGTSADYSSSKAALGMVIRDLAVELAPFQVRVNGVAPGWTAEDNLGNPLAHHKYTPLCNSSINPKFIGRAAVYLASDYFSRFTTGTVVKVDAGLSLYNHVVDMNSKHE